MLTKIKNYILSYNAGSFIKRFCMVLVALVVMNFGIACYYQCSLGTDPFSVFVDGEHSLFGLSYGWCTNINNIFLFAFMLIFMRKYIHVGSIVGVFVSGWLIDTFNVLIADLMTAISTSHPGFVLPAQIALLVVGLFAFAVAVGLYICADMGISAVEGIVLWLEEKTKINARWLRIAEDVFFMLLGMLLGGIAGRTVFGIDPALQPLTGIGTVVGAFGTGPIMKWFIDVAMKPMQKWFGPLRKTSPAPEASAEG
ncbi:MAG: hypothetical protein IJ357_02860 [Oscillospiraceae bacterium]|nr:hypothetical protein [Oscillospiraceae bacterium]